MKKCQFILIISTVYLAGHLSHAYADDLSMVCSERHDKLYCHAGEVDHLSYLGDAVLDGTTVTGSMKITGDLNMSNAQVNTINIIGDMKASDSDVNGEAVIKGDAALSNVKFRADTRIVGDAKALNTEFSTTTSIIGDIEVKNTNFRGVLTLAADKAYMSHSTALSIYFTPTYKSQNLYLNQNSYVNGDIHFPSNRGTIYLEVGSHVTGNVIGGNIVNH